MAPPEPLAQPTLQSPQITKLAERVRAGNKRAVEEFWTKVAMSGTPLIEPVQSDRDHHLVTFLWRAKSPVSNVLLISGLSNSSYSKTVLQDNLLTRLPGTDVWYRTYRVRSDARFTYRFSVNDSLVPSEEEKDSAKRASGFQPDPLNPRHVSGPTSDSLAELPNAPPQEWIQPRKGIPTGELKNVTFASKILGNERSLTIYTPPMYDPTGPPYRLVMLMFGEAYTSDIPTPV
ncbi:MAG TPA: enterochelin esterase domain-containing protein, partial [Pyrinomonadaceae bacterium]|nr:enterochelin esterase domain-containing protein [Pyrinomonadaceae bacterium]